MIFKCLIRFLNLLFTILKFFVYVMSVMWRKFPLTEVVMPSNKKPPWGPGPPASQAPPSSAEGGKSSRRQPCCCCQWHLSAAIRYMWCTWTLRNSDYPWEPRNSTRAMPLLGFTNFGESAWCLVFFGARLSCSPPWTYYCKKLTQNVQVVRKQVGFYG